MAVIEDYTGTAPVLPPRGPAPVRLRLLARAVTVTSTAPFALAPFCLWITMVAVCPLTLVAPLVLPAAVLMRAWARAERRAVGRLTGRPIPDPYRDTRGLSVLGRVSAVVRDPASWRDARWLFVHAVVGWFLAALSLTLLLGSVFYAIYPFLYWVTPHNVFGRPFGGLIELHSLAESFWFVPLGVAVFALWWAVVTPLGRAEVGLGRLLLPPAR